MVVYMQERGFNSFASKKIKLAVNETKLSTLLARTRALVPVSYTHLTLPTKRIV